MLQGTESVTPFLISFWNGTLELTPASDSWVDTARLEAKSLKPKVITQKPSMIWLIMGPLTPKQDFGPIVWDSWETNWTGIDIVESTRTRVIQNGPDIIHAGSWWQEPTTSKQRFVTDQVIEERIRSGTMVGTRSRNGVRTIVTDNLIVSLLEIELLVEISFHS